MERGPRPSWLKLKLHREWLIKKCLILLRCQKYVRVMYAICIRMLLCLCLRRRMCTCFLIIIMFVCATPALPVRACVHVCECLCQCACVCYAIVSVCLRTSYITVYVFDEGGDGKESESRPKWVPNLWVAATMVWVLQAVWPLPLYFPASPASRLLFSCE